MKLYVLRATLSNFVDNAQTTDTAWFRKRKVLWGNFKRALKGDELKNDNNAIKIPPELFITIKTSLLSRNDQFSEAARLAFETAIVDLQELIETPQDGKKGLE
jgi:hypothetical protein